MQTFSTGPHAPPGAAPLSPLRAGMRPPAGPRAARGGLTGLAGYGLQPTCILRPVSVNSGGPVSYNATARRLLISCPGDIPQTDLAIVRRAIGRWNATYGHLFASVVVPISWGLNAAAEFGRHPQEILNEQMVDDCDICLALFANRLGTETPNAESGTVEEINRLHAAGCYVAVLRSARPVDASRLDLEQATRLQAYMTDLRDKALVLTYSDDIELQSHVDAVLNTAVSRDRARAELQLQAKEDGDDVEVIRSATHGRGLATGRLRRAR